MSTTGKTPVSLLSEMLAQKRMQPIYKLLISGAGTHQGIFIYEVTAGDFVKARGRGRSKKEAKQEAAKAALQAVKEDALPVPNLDVISPYQEQLRENAVGSLSELCANSQLPAPDYCLVREDGPPHAKLFEVACKVSSFERSAVGRTKQQAKQLASKRMLDHLEELKLTITPEPEVEEMELESKEDHADLMASIRAVRSARGLDTKPAQRSLLGQQMGARLKQGWSPHELDRVRKLRVGTIASAGQLRLICCELGLVLMYREIPSRNPDVKLVVVSVSTQPSLSFVGKGPTCDQARNTAASRALRFLDTVVWPGTSVTA